MPTSRHRLSAADIAAMPERKHVHQFNPQALRLTRTLSEPLGLARLGVHLVRVPPGADSTTFHFHDAEEEFLYILCGRGIAEIGDETSEVGAGDFLAFTAPSAPHLLRNPFDEPLVYLMCGERQPLDVVHYPRLRRSMVKQPGRKRWSDWDHIHDV
jgi:uncharacterized cupin superfamily protein